MISKYYRNNEVKDYRVRRLVTRLRDKEGHIKFCYEKLKERDNPEEIVIDRRIMLRCVLKTRQ
jgi:hypothetical protein